MNTVAKLGGFGIGLAAVFTAALGLGRTVGHTPAAAPAPTHGGHAAAATAAGPATALPAGLQISQDGYRLTPLTATLATGAPREFRFQITGPDSKPVTGYTTSHDKDLHLIVVRRDLAGFQHVHPRLAADGTWSIPLAVPAPGQYRVFADFQPVGHDGLTLGADVPAPGDYRPVPLPAAARTATVDGYTVTLGGELTPGASSRLTLSVSKDGRPVTDLQPYLGAYGHLVALRDGDLAYLHVHPDGEPGDGRTQAGPEVVFHAEVPSTGAYRLYLDFQHDGKVRTAEFTAVAGAPISTPPAAATATPTPSGHGSDGHTHE
ncbi:hypothetical protein BJY16_006570 [Actinoplanes octamycinicus]|uniref:Secreted protein n=1 Tax=Actinoplanes octamycinicus TaxID=135948 RepID=A0A7W7H339_9ACTN|nr:hypothetical protein [Actinoplanes octamycinicus]MBB4743111.1 hypothetical protein [Actinoplanes octamycinicus]GIE61327.1 hypothetical protein Aoc01nite_67290 [Actinoplanes octamycinicus]